MPTTSTSQNNPFPVMERMTVKLVREYLARKQSIIVPIGIIEQHGYHLPLKTDALIAERMGWMMGKQLDMLVAPVIYSSFSGGGLPGTINISPAVMSLVVSDTLLSLASQGFRNFYLFLCHGGSENGRALDNALKLLLRTNPAFSKAMIVLMPVWKFGSANGWKQAIAEHDWHAGWLETSMVMALAPDWVRMQDLSLDPEPLLSMQIEHPDNYQHAEKIVDDAMVVARQGQRPDIQVGVMGFPKKASPELGKQLVDSCVRDACQKIAALEAKADGIYKEVNWTPDPIILT
ncbi:MAG: creatininase family protein [Verrucomicrobia bacterium]|nr:creatininase family protein [Verrucomicrobiota bacterium]MBU1734546.1 creatininase family protein [Verrucomicrobiota bacterium]MBU1856615.1 creatininase family protein [Verrucomicrobiota bacterium]